MKKRFLSFLLVLVMLVTLFPFSAFALGDIAITKQPTSQTVYAGDDAVFQIEAKRTGTLTGGNVNYLWYNADEFDLSGLEFLLKVTTVLGKALSVEQTLVLENVTTDMDGMNIRCAAYYVDGFSKRGIEISNTITLHVKEREACAVHDLVYHQAKAPTCVHEGNIEYWQCDVCHRIYLDSAANFEITIKDTVVAKDPTAHDMEHHDRVEPTCQKDGNIEYWQCNHCGNRYKNPEGTGNTLKLSDIEIDNSEAKHQLTYVPYKAATCCVEGNKEYYVCDVCGDYFNGAGTVKYSKSEVKLAVVPHTPAYTHDETYHWQYCTMCDTIIDNTTELHNDAQHKATCCSKAVCECGYEHGDFDLDNHVNTEIRDFREATTEAPGYTGDKWCLDCGLMVAEGYESDQLCAHELQHFDAKEEGCEYREDGGTGNIEYWYCDKCGCYYTDENAENEVSEDEVFIAAHTHYITVFGQTTANLSIQQYAYDATGHWKECKYCHYQYNIPSSHTMNPLDTPTCCSGKTCMACGYDDGQRDPSNHVGGTEIVGVCEPDGKNPGYTGDTVCLGCGEIIQKGWEYYPVCEDGKCADHLKHIAAVPSTCTADGTLEHWQCRKCGNIYMDEGATIPGDKNSIVDKCTGHELHPGTDALSSVDIFTIASKMGWEVSDILDIIESGNYSDLSKITLDDFLDKITVADIDHCHDDTYHWLGCQKCGKSLADIRPDLEAQGLFLNEKWYQLSAKQEHSGGHADCSHMAVCDVCGEEYGSVGGHEYNWVVTPATCTEPGKREYVCNGCGLVDESRTEYFPATGHCYEKGVCKNCGSRITNPFWDISNKDQYYTAIMWAYTYNPQITSGIDTTHFCPSDPCTRGQVVTFLWRAAGCPEPSSLNNPFSDVFSTGSCAPFYKAILWAAEQGITTGYNDGTFKPSKTVTRAEFVTFLWRYFDKPATSGSISGFADAVTIATPYRDAVAWAVENGITTGYQDNTFRPNETCKRWQVVMFMYRAIGEGKAY